MTAFFEQTLNTSGFAVILQDGAAFLNAVSSFFST